MPVEVFDEVPAGSIDVSSLRVRGGHSVEMCLMPDVLGDTPVRLGGTFRIGVASIYMNATRQVLTSKDHTRIIKESQEGTTVNRVKGQLVVAVLAVALFVIGAACGSDEAGPETAVSPAVSEGSPLAPEGIVPAPQEVIVEPGDPGPPVTSTMLAPRPESIEVLVRMSNVIVLGTISGVLDEKLIGAYGEDGNPYVPVEESGSPFTDYEVRVESVLKNDGDVEDGATLVLRMVGHLSRQNDLATLAESWVFLSRIQIHNFRNFHELDVRLGPTTVVVGENNVGKSNLLFALRLILDPRLADSSR